MNRLERYSRKFMTRKSNTVLASHAPKHLNVVNKAQPPVGDTKYDWKANLEARKHQRELGKGKNADSSHVPIARHRAPAHDGDRGVGSRTDKAPVTDRWKREDRTAKGSSSDDRPSRRNQPITGSTELPARTAHTARIRGQVTNNVRAASDSANYGSFPRTGRQPPVSASPGEANVAATRKGRLAAISGARKF